MVSRDWERHDNKGEHDHAIDDYNKAIEINPKDAAAYYNRGNAYEKKGDKARAIADFSKAIEINPNDQDAKNSLARLGASP
jgi:tetratricopeptide (TPR) repeat protein